MKKLFEFQHTAARRRLLSGAKIIPLLYLVSTHSRPKAAARHQQLAQSHCYSFNTQPPEGGCIVSCLMIFAMVGFNTQPPEGGCCRSRQCKLPT